jgi:hypothetical protein
LRDDEISGSGVFGAQWRRQQARGEGGTDESVGDGAHDLPFDLFSDFTIAQKCGPVLCAGASFYG